MRLTSRGPAKSSNAIRRSLIGSKPISSGETEDVYEFHAGYKDLDPNKAIMNPDPFAVFVRQVYHNGTEGPGTHK